MDCGPQRTLVTAGFNPRETYFRGIAIYVSLVAGGSIVGGRVALVLHWLDSWFHSLGDDGDRAAGRAGHRQNDARLGLGRLKTRDRASD